MPSGISPRDLSEYRNFFRNFPDYSVKFSEHAQERLDERGFNPMLLALKNTLRAGKVLRVEFNIDRGNDEFRIAGRDLDGRPIVLVVALDKTRDGCISVITVIDPS